MLGAEPVEYRLCLTLDGAQEIEAPARIRPKRGVLALDPEFAQSKRELANGVAQPSSEPRLHLDDADRTAARGREPRAKPFEEWGVQHVGSKPAPTYCPLMSNAWLGRSRSKKQVLDRAIAQNESSGNQKPISASRLRSGSGILT